MRARRLFWRIVEQIELLIDSGTFPAGSRLPPERELAETYNVSRPTIREALIALEVRERLEVKVGSGIYVVENTKPKTTDCDVTAFELTQARALIEGEAAALAATSITSEELDKLHEALLDMEMESDTSESSGDRQFHLIISKSTRNNALLAAIERLWHLRATSPNVIAAYKDVCHVEPDDRMDEHQAIYEALKSGDAGAARTAMHTHFNRLINALFDADEKKAIEEMRRKTNAARDLYSLKRLSPPDHAGN